eukprot:1268888-Pleurochrysis_carterae.AAC.3
MLLSAAIGNMAIAQPSWRYINHYLAQWTTAVSAADIRLYGGLIFCVLYYAKLQAYLGGAALIS